MEKTFVIIPTFNKNDDYDLRLPEFQSLLKTAGAEITGFENCKITIIVPAPFRGKLNLDEI